MKHVLGRGVAYAKERLEAEGKPVRTVEVRSKKGGKGDDARVINAVGTAEETIVYWSYFRTNAASSPIRDKDGSPCAEGQGQ